ncbi:hypothetical protein ACFX2H_012705 [Malus domestica]
MDAFISTYSDNHREKGSELAPWLDRLTTLPPQLADFGYLNEIISLVMQEVWRHRVESYWNLMSKKIKPNTLRNET